MNATPSANHQLTTEAAVFTWQDWSVEENIESVFDDLLHGGLEDGGDGSPTIEEIQLGSVDEVDDGFIEEISVEDALSTDERRVATRHRIQTRVDFSSEDNFFVGFSGDISEGGVYVQTVDVLPLGSELSLDIELPSGDVLSCQGTVRWVRRPDEALDDSAVESGMGIQFTAVQDAVLLADFIDRREPLFFPE